MKCMSCQAEVPPAWVHAINSNICPGCGGSIMDTQSQMILAEVRDAMNQMANNPEGLAGWLLSNYKLTKVGDSEPTEFHQRGSAGTPAVNPGNQPDVKIPRPDPGASQGAELFQQFLKRTGVKLPDANALKRNAGTTASFESIEEEDDEAYDSDEDVEIEGLGNSILNTPASNPHEAIRRKQMEARKAITSGGGKFSRSS